MKTEADYIKDNLDQLRRSCMARMTENEFIVVGEKIDEIDRLVDQLEKKAYFIIAKPKWLARFSQ